MAETWGDAIRYFRQTDGLKEMVVGLSDAELMVVIRIMLDNLSAEKRTGVQA